MVLDHTPFYAESGGQVGDTGTLVAGIGAVRGDRHAEARQRLRAHRSSDERRIASRAIASKRAWMRQRRRATVLNHSATHLLHAALRKVLGTHVTQKGSLVAPDRLRFDFSHFAADDADRAAGNRTPGQCARSVPTPPAETQLMQYDAAVASGAMALFGEKYDDEVRVLRFGDFSTELCGGTHVRRAGDIGLFKIVSEGGVAAGVRRIEAVTGQGALDWVAKSDQVLRELASLVKASRDDVEDKVRQLVERSRKLEKEVAGLKSKLASGQGNGSCPARRSMSRA